MQNLSVFLPMSFQGKIAGVCFGFELAFFLLDAFLVGSTNVLLQVSPNVSANLSKEITWCLPGSTHCLSSSICLMGLMRSIWAGSQLCLSANVFLMRILLMSSRTELCVCQCLSSELNRCLPLSVSQCLLPNLSKEPLDVFLDQPSVCLLGLIGVLTELALTCLLASV